MISTAQLGRAGYVAALLLSGAAAVLAVTSTGSAALTLLSLAAAALSFAVWISMRRLAGLVSGSARRASHHPADLAPVLSAVRDVAAQLRDLPVVTQQSTVVTEIVGRLENELLAADMTAVPSRLDEVSNRLNEVATCHNEISSRLDDVSGGVDELVTVGDARYRSLIHRLDLLETSVQQTPGLTIELDRLSKRLGPGGEPLPVPGGWALSAQTLIALVSEVLGTAACDHVVECGSGTSTVWTALAMRHRGSGHVFALEHDRHFAEVTRAQLRAQGLEEWATVIDAPLVQTPVGDGSALWYDPSALDTLPAQIDLLLVDGPPGDTQPHARHPAYVLLAARLGHDAVVILDDTNRPAEREIAEEWLGHPTNDRQLVERMKVGRSTVFDVRVEPASV